MYFHSNTGNIEDFSSALVTNLNLLKHSRAFEKEADLLALDYLQKSGISPIHFLDAIKKLFNYFCGTEEINPADDCMGDQWSWLATHPSGNNRLDYINQYFQ